MSHTLRPVYSEQSQRRKKDLLSSVTILHNMYANLGESSKHLPLARRRPRVKRVVLVRRHIGRREREEGLVGEERVRTEGARRTRAHATPS